MTVLHRTARVMLTAAATVAAVSTFAVLAGLVTGRWRVLPVLSDSMRPAMPVGSLVVAVPVGVDELAAGDVLLFHAPTPERTLTVHRIVELRTENGHRLVRTKGDNNASPDPWLLELQDAEAWKVATAVPHVGRLASLVHQPGASFALATLLVLLAIAAALRRVWRVPDEGHEPGCPAPRPAAAGLVAVRWAPRPVPAAAPGGAATAPAAAYAVRCCSCGARHDRAARRRANSASTAQP